MITPEDVRHRLTWYAGKPLRDIGEQLWFEDHGWEAAAGLFRTSPGAFDSLLHFWVDCVRTGEQRRCAFGPFDYSTLKCEPLSDAAFCDLVKRCFPNIPDIKLAWKGKYLTGVLIAADWNYVSGLAEFEEEYVSVFWSTTA
jgi:hypothetical protein